MKMNEWPYSFMIVNFSIIITQCQKAGTMCAVSFCLRDVKIEIYFGNLKVLTFCCEFFMFAVELPLKMNQMSNPEKSNLRVNKF